MALVVKEQPQKFTATVEDKEKLANVIHILKDPIYPSLFYLKYAKGENPDAFKQKFNDLYKAVDYAKEYIENMRVTAAVKGKIKDGDTSKETDTVRKGADH